MNGLWDVLRFGKEPNEGVQGYRLTTSGAICARSDAFTKANNFQFNIGVASVFFENKDGELVGGNAVEGVMTNPVGGRLRR